MAIATTAIGTRIVRTMTRLGVRVRRLSSMRILVVRVIIRRGTLMTDTFFLRGRSLSGMFIRLSWRWVLTSWWILIGLGISLCVRWWILILRLTRRTRRTKGLTMGTIQHWRLFTIPGILSILARSVLTCNRSSCASRTIDSSHRDERSLRRDGMEQTLLIEASAVLTSSVRRAIIAGATNLDPR